MLRLLLFVSFLVAGCVARPTDIESRAKLYALLHPNVDTQNEEYGAYFEGDIEVDDKEGEKIDVNPLNAIINPNRHWPNGLSHYTIQNGVYTAAQLRLIENGISDLVNLTKVNGRECISILPRNNEANFISVQHFSGCSSSVGRVGGSQRLSLVDSCVARHGTIMHEFLHAYGFYHEQSRTDRDDYVTVMWDNIQPGTENNFNKYDATVITPLGTPYDYGSVLHYSAYGFAIDPTKPTLVPTDPDAVIGQRVTLSRYDIERVQLLYKCINPRDTIYFNKWTREQLDAIYN